MGANTSTNTFWLSPKLTQWSSSQESSLVVVKGPFSTRSAILDFGASVIQALSALAIPTVWALTSAEKSASSSSILTPTTLMKYLTYQALRLSSKAYATTQTEKWIALRHSQFRTAETWKEWCDLFRQVIMGLPGKQAYVVVDLAAVRSELESGTADDFNFFQELNRVLISRDDDVIKHSAMKLKVVIFLYEANWVGRLPYEASNSVVPVKVAKSKKPRRRKEMQKAVNTRVFPSNRSVRVRAEERK